MGLFDGCTHRRIEALSERCSEHDLRLRELRVVDAVNLSDGGLLLFGPRPMFDAVRRILLAKALHDDLDCAPWPLLGHWTSPRAAASPQDEPTRSERQVERRVPSRESPGVNNALRRVVDDDTHQQCHEPAGCFFCEIRL